MPSSPPSAMTEVLTANSASVPEGNAASQLPIPPDPAPMQQGSAKPMLTPEEEAAKEEAERLEREARATAEQKAVAEGLRRSWAPMSDEEFLAFIRRMPDAVKRIQKSLRSTVTDAVGEEAARRLLETDVVQQGSYEIIYALMLKAEESLSKRRLAALREKLVRPSENSASLTFDEMKLKYSVLERAGLPYEVSEQPIKDWLDARKLSEIATEELEWCIFDALAWSLARRNNGLSVTWMGAIHPPQDGEYTFTSGPLRIDLQNSSHQIRSTIKVWIDGRLVLLPGTNGPESRPIQLSAKRPASIRIEYAYEHNGKDIVRAYPPVARLFWESPEVSRQIVPASALSPPAGEGTGPGLLGEYVAAQGESAPLENRQIDRQIDFTWILGHSFIIRNPTHIARYMDELVSRISTQEYFTKCRENLENGMQFRALRNRLEAASELMKPEQRAKVIRAMAGNQRFLKLLSAEQAADLFYIFRPGAETDAIELLGAYFHSQSNPETDIAVDFFWSNHGLAEELAENLTFDFSNGHKQLEKYWRRPDGNCCLQAVYVLNYANALTGTLDDWIAKLDAVIAQPSVEGTERVNWLLARTHAEELRGERPTERLDVFPQHPRAWARHQAAWKFLEEAETAAPDEETAFRVMWEKLARAAGADQRTKMDELLEQADTQFKSDEYIEAIAHARRRWETARRQFDAYRIQNLVEHLAAEEAKRQDELKQQKLQQVRSAQN